MIPRQTIYQSIIRLPSIGPIFVETDQRLEPALFPINFFRKLTMVVETAD